MRKAVFEWVTLLTALAIVGPFVALPLAWLTTASGATDATPLTSTQPALGIGYTLLAMVGALLAGWLGTKTVSRGMGMAAAGFVLVWVAARSGTSAMILRDAGSASAAAIRLTIEAAILAIPALWLVTIVQRPTPIESDESVYPLTECRTDLVQGLKDAVTSRGLQVVLAAAAGAILGSMFASIGMLKGQAIFDGFFAGLLGGAGGGLLLAGVENPRPALAPYLGVALVMIAAPIAASFYHGASLRTVAVTGELIAPARLIPMDWIAGMLIGVPWGLSWLASSVKEKPEPKRV
ncbi:MAG: hypothetical protein K2Y21_10210 [Phycisphaerales bacterium]|nr:hypothetical protein [Phycisphaerales bacterium]